MEINDTLLNLENALSAMEYHTDNLKKAIAIAKQIKAKYDGENLTEAEDTFSDNAGYGARRFNNASEIYGDFEVDFLFRIERAIDEYKDASK